MGKGKKREKKGTDKGEKVQGIGGEKGQEKKY